MRFKKAISFIMLSLFALFVPICLLGQNWVTNNAKFSHGIVHFNSDSIRVYISGIFTNVNDSTTYAFCSWDGNNIDRYNSCIINGPVACSVLYNDTLIIGGDFPDIDGNTLCKRVAKWNGNHWEPLGQGFNGLVFNLRVLDGELYAVGGFNLSGSSELNGIAKWNGNEWVSVYNLPQYDGNIVYDICKYNNEVYIGGNFYSNDSNNIKCIAKYNGLFWESVGGGILGEMGVNRMLVYKNKLVVAGLFYKQFGNTGNFIMTWDGNQWEDMGGGTWGQINNPGSLGTIFDMSVYNDMLYICGIFNYAGTTPASHVAVWDGEKWCGYPGVFDNSVYAMTIFRDTIFIACGKTIDGDTVNHFAKWSRGLEADTCGLISVPEIITGYNKILICPNPVSDEIVLLSNGNFGSFYEMFTYSIFDCMGRIILSGKTKGLPNKISVPDLNQGVYMLQLSSVNFNWKGKFLKE